MKTKILVFGVLMLSIPSIYGQGVQEKPPYSTDQEKAEWIKENPEKYKELGGVNSAEKTVIIKDLKVTSNPWGDDRKKTDWVNENPNEYQELVKDAALGQDNGLPWKRDELKEQWVKDHPQEAKELKIIPTESTDDYKNTENAGTRRPLVVEDNKKMEVVENSTMAIPIDSSGIITSQKRELRACDRPDPNKTKKN